MVTGGPRDHSFTSALGVNGQGALCAVVTRLGSTGSDLNKWPTGFLLRIIPGLQADLNSWDWGSVDLHLKKKGPCILKFENFSYGGFPIPVSLVDQCVNFNSSFRNPNKLLLFSQRLWCQVFTKRLIGISFE